MKLVIFAESLAIILELPVGTAIKLHTKVKLSPLASLLALPSKVIGVPIVPGPPLPASATGATLAKLIEMHRGALEMTDILERIKKLEAKVKK